MQEKLAAVEVAIDLIGRRLDLLGSPLDSSGSLHQDQATPSGQSHHEVAAAPEQLAEVVGQSKAKLLTAYFSSIK